MVLVVDLLLTGRPTPTWANTIGLVLEMVAGKHGEMRLAILLPHLHLPLAQAPLSHRPPRHDLRAPLPAPPLLPSTPLYRLFPHLTSHRYNLATTMMWSPTPD